MGGMLAQLFVLYLGEKLVAGGLSTESVTMVTFGAPRVGDSGFEARLRLLYPDETRLINVLYNLVGPLDARRPGP
jgi:hypothetical protein